MNKILDIMVAQHALIDTLFVAFRDELGQNPKGAQGFFTDLVWEVKKHFFVEEQAIFDLIPWKDPEIQEIVKGLKQDHFILLGSLDKASKDLSVFNSIQKDGFSALMAKHLETEEKKLYPILDERLTEEEKKHIISHIAQVPLSQL